MAQYGELRADFITYTTGTVPAEANQTITVSSLIENPSFDSITVAGDAYFQDGITVTGIVIATDKVGIGTSSPSYSLHVVTSGEGVDGVSVESPSGSGLIRLRPDGTNGNVISYGGTGAQADNLRFLNVADEEMMRIDTIGNVGIGAASPTQKLDLEDINGARIAFTDTGTRRYSIGNAGTILTIRDETDSFDRFSINRFGQVGIGTISPVATLEVVNDSNTPGGTIQRWVADIGTNIRTALLIAPEADNVDDPFIFSTSAAWQFRVDTTDALTIDSNGNVGIGTSNPSANLHIEATGAALYIDDPASTNPLRLTQTGTNAEVLNGATGNIEFGLANDGNILFVNGVAQNERMRIDSSGRVGIGTSTPGAKLDITASGDDYFPAIELTNFGGTGIGSAIRSKRGLSLEADYDNNSGASESEIVFKTDNSQRMVIDANGNVGIGAIAPGSKLVVAGNVDISGAANKFIGPTAAQGSTAATPTFSFSGQNTGMFLASNNELGFSTAATERLRIDANGKVGIGASSPQVNLHIASATGTASPTPTEVRISTTSAAENWSTTDPWGRISFYSADGSGSGPKVHAAIDAVSAGTGGGASNLQFKVSGTDAVLDTALVIDSDSNVGIGTSTTNGKLEVRAADATQTLNLVATENAANAGGSIHFYAANRSDAGEATAYIKSLLTNNNGGSGNVQLGDLVFGTQNTERMRIDSNGNVGIGTSSPVEKFHVHDGNVIIGQTSGASTNIRNYVKFGRTSGPKAAIGFLNNAANGRGDLLFMNSSVSDANEFTDAEEVMRIDSSGNVGIGTSSPGSFLTVQTNTEPDPADVAGNAKGSIFLANSGGTPAQDALGNGIGFSRINTTRRGAMIASYQPTTDADQCGLAFYTRSGTNTASDAVVQRVVIDHSGNVGIGTSSPGEKLEVNGTIKATDINFTGLATYADDAAAGTGGLVAGDVYKTSTGELRIKL